MINKVKKLIKMIIKRFIMFQTLLFLAYIEKYLDRYFETIKRSLNVNGTAAIQGITIRNDLFDRYRNSEDFIQKYIFPGGFLPSLGFMKSLIKKNKLTS